MRIAVDARMIRSSGIGKVIENVLQRMVLLHMDWEFFLLGRENELSAFAFARASNVQWIECDVPIYSLSEQLQLVQRIPANMDWFWSPHYNVPFFYRGRLLVTIHDVFHLAMPAFVHGIHKRLYARSMFAAAVKKADRIICVSHFTAQELQRFTGVSGRKLQIVYNGVDESWWSVKKRPGLYARPYFVYVGNIKPHKNLIRLLQAYSVIMHEVKQDLILVGKKEGFLTGMGSTMQALLEKIGNRVSFTGWIEDNVLQEYVAGASAMIFPSLYEGFGLPPLEAMACGCPVVVSRAASLPEVCGDGAIYCDPYDVMDIARAMKEVLNADLVEAGRRVAERYSWDSTVRGMLRIIEGEE